MLQRPRHPWFGSTSVARSIRTWSGWGALVVLAALSGCTVESTTLDPLPFGECLCADATCPTAVCDLRVEVDPKTCAGKVGEVEILIGEQLEQRVWSPGDNERTCSTIPRGASAKLFARADTDWQWRETVACPAPDGAVETEGPTIVRILHCTSAK